ncbi:hypothetical protein B0T14DRAFT_80028 [Immersiella caudata]|uniref:Uncharacterized protein n=1 Tax=Immersiella caudata TaxID=314043 RepID=A0AA39XGY3_9PEZI|nr:hypothetical protein B0T14DRAFT_80028 [Immersiella caudata]
MIDLATVNRTRRAREGTHLRGRDGMPQHRNTNARQHGRSRSRAPHPVTFAHARPLSSCLRCPRCLCRRAAFCGQLTAANPTRLRLLVLASCFLPSCRSQQTEPGRQMV